MKKVLLSQGSIYYSHMRSENVPENMNSRHCHDRYEILYIAEGSGKYIVEGAEYPVRARTLMIFPPLVYHCVSVDVGTVYERSVLYFDEKDVECLGKEIIDAFNGAEDGAGVFYSAESISDSVTSIFEKLEARGFTKEQLSFVHTPIGLDISSEVPNEIAVSIMAEVLMVKNGKDRAKV